MSEEIQSPSNAPVDAGSQALAEALRGSFAIVKVVMAILVVVFIASGFFTVGPQEKAIVLRWGKPTGTGNEVLLGAGAHWAWPYPIDEVIKVPFTEIQQVRSSVGWYATTPEQELAGTEPPPNPSLNPAIDGFALTADGNIVHVRATLRYRIDDPVRYVFGFVNASNALQNTLNNSLIYAASRYKVDDILSSDVLGFRELVTRRVTGLIEDQKLGVALEQCTVESVPPRQLKPAFDNVIMAGQSRRRLLDEARSYENKIMSAAGAESVSRTNLAESDRTRLVEQVTSDANNFRSLLPSYQANPELFAQYRLVETMGRVATNVSEKIFMPERADGKSRELRLLLNREPYKAAKGDGLKR